MNNLSETEFQLLAMLGSREKSGRDIAADFMKETGREISYGTLYTTLRRLREAGFVEMREGQDNDGRIRYFTLLASGRRTLADQRRIYSALAAFGRSTGSALP